MVQGTILRYLKNFSTLLTTLGGHPDEKSDSPLVALAMMLFTLNRTAEKQAEKTSSPFKELVLSINMSKAKRCIYLWLFYICVVIVLFIW